MTTIPPMLAELARSSADPEGVRLVFEKLAEGLTGGLERVEEPLGRQVAAVAGASRSLRRLIVADPDALVVLEAGAGLPARLEVAGAGDAAELGRRRQLAFLRIAAGDLLGESSLEEVGASLSHLADEVLETAVRLAAEGGEDSLEDGLAVIGMGKHGAEELNYSSDVDVLFVAANGAELQRATATARRVLAIASGAYRIDTDLRPEGRNGVLVRTLGSYEAYWERWARPWEFQALLKQRPSAGDRETGQGFAEAAREAVWSRPMDSDSLAELRTMKSRAEEMVRRRGVSDRELKRGRGGIRDIEFSAQLLQLVHGRGDPALRVSATLDALAELSAAGYIDSSDATILSLAYRFLRTVEHRLQLVDEAQVHTLPPPGPARDHLARVLDMVRRRGTARQRYDRLEVVLSRYQSSVRSIHERLFFRPLLEAFSSPSASRMSEAAATERLSAFGFRDTERTRQALAELTRGLTRSSRLMQQLLPVLLDWLSNTPDPDLGLLGLRNLAGLAHQRDVLVSAFRDSPELARRLCVVLGTSRRLGELARRHPALSLRLGDDVELAPVRPTDLFERAAIAAEGPFDRTSRALRRVVSEELLRIGAGDVLGALDSAAVPRQLAALGDAALTAALQHSRPKMPFGLVAMGRLGGSELSYGSDLDILLVHGGTGPDDAAEAERVATSLFRLLNGPTPADAIWTADASLRPEGSKGPLARSIDAYGEYYRRWVSTWERQALIRARPVAGDSELLSQFMALVQETVWEHTYTPEDVREIRRLKARAERERIPAGEDPQFHLKLGKGSLSDIEWTVQLLQLQAGVASPNTTEAIGLLEGSGALDDDEARVLREALSFLGATRDRWHLVGNFIAAAGAPVSRLGSDSLPQSAEALSRLARSLQEAPGELREHYRRVTRRARRIVERRFYEL